MKLQYFTQAAADLDDSLLQLYIHAEVVPATCLLGGKVIESVQKTTGADPCERCEGPRPRCHGRPKITADDDRASAERKRIQEMLEGTATPFPGFES